MRFVLAIDQGTTSSRAILFDHAGAISGIAQQEFTQHYPASGWVEHDANEIWESQLAVAREVLLKCNATADDVAAIGIANQRETTVVWDRASGQPIHNAIVWQDRRTAEYCDELREAGHADWVQQKTGLLIDSYFCATKLRWLLDHVPGARDRAQRGELAFGTIDSWLLWNLTGDAPGGAIHQTDISNASRTMLLNLDSGEWDDELLDFFNVPRSVLPEVQPSSHCFGETGPTLFGKPIQLGGAAGDQQAALFGQNCAEVGMAKNTYGTGCFMLMNVGNEPIRSQRKLLTSIACTTSSHRQYALEGSVFVAGAIVQWLRDGLGMIQSASEIEALAASVEDSDGVYLVPALAGLGAPHWDAYARGTIVGLSRGTTRAHIARAALEGIAFQVADVAEVMIEEANVPLDQLRVDGGAAVNNLLMQFQADIMQRPIVRPKTTETTALGAAFLAGLSSGFWSGEDQIKKVWHVDRVFEPKMSKDEAAYRRSRWNDALTRAKSWDRPES